MTRALITGASGFVGSHLAEYLLEHTDWHVVGMIRWRSPLDNLQGMGILSRANNGERVSFVCADLRDAIAVREAVKFAAPDYVFHLAAQSYPQTSFASPLDTMDTNASGTVRLLDALKEHAPEALIHVCSSSEVYGRAKVVPITEDAPFHPASPYAISKVATDLFARHYAEAYGMKIMTTRMFTHTGPRRGDVFAESSFAKQLAMIEAGQLKPVVMTGNLESLRTIADVRDAVRAYHLLLTVNPQPGAVYNIGGEHTCTVREILRALADLTQGGALIRYRTDPARMRPIDADNQVPDCSAFKAHTGWKPDIPFAKTMRDLLDYWRARVKTSMHLAR